MDPTSIPEFIPQFSYSQYYPYPNASNPDELDEGQEYFIEGGQGEEGEEEYDHELNEEDNLNALDPGQQAQPQLEADWFELRTFNPLLTNSNPQALVEASSPISSCVFDTYQELLWTGQQNVSNIFLCLELEKWLPSLSNG